MSRPQAHGDAVLATLADNIVSRQAPVIARDAEALVSVAAWPDFPEGLAVIEPPLGAGPAFTIGSGHLLAAALGSRFRPAAVAVDVARLLRDGLRAHGLDEVDAVVAGVAIEAEAVAIHEAAHAAVAPLDDVADEAALVTCRLVAASPSALRPGPWIEAHGPAWAIAYAVLAERAIRFRPNVAAELRAMVDADLGQHGVDPCAITAAVAGFPEDAALRGLLDAELLARATAAMLPDDERLAMVETLARRGAVRAIVGTTAKGSVDHGGGRYGAPAAPGHEAA